MRDNCLDEVINTPHFKLIILISSRESHAPTTEKPLEGEDTLFISLVLTERKARAGLKAQRELTAPRKGYLEAPFPIDESSHIRRIIHKFTA